MFKQTSGLSMFVSVIRVELFLNFYGVHRFSSNFGAISNNLGFYDLTSWYKSHQFPSLIIGARQGLNLLIPGVVQRNGNDTGCFYIVGGLRLILMLIVSCVDVSCSCAKSKELSCLLFKRSGRFSMSFASRMIRVLFLSIWFSSFQNSKLPKYGWMDPLM